MGYEWVIVGGIGLVALIIGGAWLYCSPQPCNCVGIPVLGDDCNPDEVIEVPPP